MKKHWTVFLIGIGLLLAGCEAVRSLRGGAPSFQAEPTPVSLEGRWRQARPMPTQRSEMVAAALDGRIYVAGGMARTSAGVTVASTVFEVYDPQADTWAALPAMPLGLHHLAIAAWDGVVYVSGGFDDSFDPDVQSLFAYDVAAQTWAQRADMPAARGAHFMVALDGRLYVVGGVGPDNTALWIYDPATDTWETGPAPLPTPREHTTAAVLDGALYVIGGRWSNTNLSVLERYDPQTQTWTRLADMPLAVGGLTAGALDGRIHVTGGEDLRTSQTYNTHMIYDPQSDTWATGLPLPTARHGLASAVVGDRWFVIGGGREAGARTTATLSALVEYYTTREP